MGFDAYRSPQATPLCPEGDYLQRFAETPTYNECEAKQLEQMAAYPDYVAQRTYALQEYEPGAMTYVKGRTVKG